MAAGAAFALEDHPLKDYDGDYYVIEAVHSISAPGYEAGASQSGESYDVSFNAA